MLARPCVHLQGTNNIVPSPYRGLVSGVVRCGLQTYTDTNFPGGDLPNQPAANVSDVATCCRTCQNLPECYAWSFTNRTTCYLKVGTEGSTESKHVPKRHPWIILKV